MAELPLFPLPNTVVFPGMTIPLYIFEERYKRLVRFCLEQDKPRFVTTLSKPTEGLVDDEASIFNAGTYIHIVEVNENPDGTFNLIGHGQERCQISPSRTEEINELDGSKRPLHFTEATEADLRRSDPNLERVTAWDTLEVFKGYAKTFFTKDVLKQLENVIPEDLVYQASFICANVRIPASDRQRLLEAESLIKRFELVQMMMEERIKVHSPA